MLSFPSIHTFLLAIPCLTLLLIIIVLPFWSLFPNSFYSLPFFKTPASFLSFLTTQLPESSNISSLHLTSICLATIQDTADKSDLQLVLPLNTITASPQPHNHNLGNWQPSHIYNGCSILRSHLCHLQSSQTTSDKTVNGKVTSHLT